MSDITLLYLQYVTSNMVFVLSAYTNFNTALITYPRSNQRYRVFFHFSWPTQVVMIWRTSENISYSYKLCKHWPMLFWILSQCCLPSICTSPYCASGTTCININSFRIYFHNLSKLILDVFLRKQMTVSKHDLLYNLPNIEIWRNMSRYSGW